MTYSESIGNISEIYRIQKEELEGLNKFFLENLGDKGLCPIEGGKISFRDLLDIIRQSYDEYILLLSRVDSILNSIKEGKISKTDTEVLKEHLSVIMNINESLRNEYLGTLSVWRKYFTGIYYEEMSIKIFAYRDFLNMASEFTIEIQKLLKFRIHDDAEFYYFDKPKTTLVRLNDIISYDSESFEFILNSNKSEKYSIHGYPNRIKFMETLINAKEGMFVPHSEFIANIGLTYRGTGHGKDEEGQVMRIKSELIRDIKMKFRGIEIDFISTKKGYKLKR